MAWSFNADAPIYLQAAEILRRRILTGSYPSGQGIPTVRELAQEAAVNPNTMQRALSYLETTGLIITQRTAGRKVTEDRELILLMRREEAKKQIECCVCGLEELGFTGSEITKMMNQWIRIKEGWRDGSEQ